MKKVTLEYRVIKKEKREVLISDEQFQLLTDQFLCSPQALENLEQEHLPPDYQEESLEVFFDGELICCY
jgi:hypothetical protein